MPLLERHAQSQILSILLTFGSVTKMHFYGISEYQISNLCGMIGKQKRKEKILPKHALLQLIPIRNTIDNNTGIPASRILMSVLMTEVHF